MNNIRKEIIKGLFSRGSFVRNLTIFTGGSLIAFLIGFIFTPIITRIYDPKDYGTFAFFNTVLALIISLAPFSYNEALILPRNTKDFFRLSRLIVTTTAFFALTFTFFLFLFREPFLLFFNVERLGVLIFIVPILLMISTLQTLADNYNIRRKQFSINARSKIASVISAKSLVASLGLLNGSSSGGLILGEVVIRGVNIVSLLGKNCIKFPVRIVRAIKIYDLIAIGKEYKQYPLFIFPASILLQSSFHLPVFIIGKIYSVETLGYYSLAMSLLGIPIQVIGFSMGKVFLQKANEIAQNQGVDILRHQLIRFYYVVLTISIAGYGLVFIFGEKIFRVFAGNEWAMSGQIASILSASLAFQLLAIVIGPLFRILRKEKVQLKANLYGSLVMLSALIFSLFINIEFIDFLILLAIVLLLKHLIFVSFSLSLILTDWIKHIILSLLLLVIVFAFYYLLSLLFHQLI